MFGNKKLLKRLRSLEEYLDISYAPSEVPDKWDNGTHIADDWGRMKTLNKLIEKKQKEDNKEKNS